MLWFRKIYDRIYFLAVLAFLCFLVILARQALGQSDSFQLIETRKEIGITPLAKVKPSWLQYSQNRNYFGYIPGRNFFITQPKIGARLRYEFKDETRKNGAVSVTDQYHKFGERIGFNSIGWVFYPNFCQFNITFEPEWTQVYEKDPDGNVSRSNIFSPDYLLTTTFFKKKDISFRFHGSRVETPSWSAFQGGIESLSHKFGGEADFNYKVWQNKFHANLGYILTENNVDGFNSWKDTNHDYFITVMQDHPRSKSSLDIDYSDDKRITNNERSNRIRKFELYFSNLYKLESNKFSGLNSIIRYSTYKFNSDSAASDTLSLSSDFNIQHRQNLRSFYNVNILRSGISGRSKNNRIGIHTRLSHLLYENLYTNANLNISYSNSTIGLKSTSLNPSLRLKYIRFIPGGQVNLQTYWSYKYTARENEISQQYNDVINERHLLQLGEETYLNNSFIDESSIVITDSSMSLQYIKDIDYVLEKRGDYILIRRTSFGDIEDNQTILAHYRYYIDPENTDGTFVQTYSGNINLFKKWNFSLSHSRYNQFYYEGQAPLSSLDGSSTSAGVSYNTGWSDTDLSLGRHDRASDLSYFTWKINQRFRFNPFRRFRWKMSFSYAESSYGDEDVKHSYGVSVDASWKIMRNLGFSMNGYSSYYEFGEEKSNNIGFSSSINYSWRIWTVSLKYDLLDQHDDISDTSRIRNLIRFDIVRLKW